LPCHFTLDQNEIPLVCQFCRGPPAQIGSSCPPWILPDFTTRKAILESFIPQRVRRVGWLGSRWILEVENPDETTVASLPRVLNGLLVSYHEFVRIPLREHGITHTKVSLGNVFDNTNYAPRMHAGMLLTDGDTITTSGCPISHPSEPDAKYFTIAAHGFVIGGDVFHPGPPPLGKVIATADKKFAETDIGLAKITHSSIDYFPDTFAGPGGTVRLKRLLREENSLLTKEVFYDSPFTGLGSGLVVGHGLDAIPVDEPNDEWAYVATIWVTFGSGADDPVGGSCGSPLFDQDGNVLGFYRYFATNGSGISYCPTADPLIDAGFKIASFQHMETGLGSADYIGL